MEKKKIVDVLDGNSMDFVKLIKKLQEPSDVVEKALHQLEDQGIVFFDGKEYALLKDHNLYLGTILVRKRTYAYVHVNGIDHDFKLSGEYLTGLIGGDRIYISLERKGDICHFAGFYRRKTKLIGTLTKKPRKGFYILTPDLDESNVRIKFSNDPLDFDAEDGDMVFVSIDDYNATEIYATFLKVLVKKTDVGSDISKIILNAEAPIDFDDEVLVEARTIPQEVKEKDYSDREDLRDHLIVTIDGKDALDFDDAVEIKRIPNGYEIGVHIADVSYYVRPGSKLDESAYERGTSIYVADRVVPMLPTELSNGICSLNPDVDRLAMSVIMNVDNYGNVYKSRLTQTVIRSHARLTYSQVNDLLDGKDCELDSEIQEVLQLLFEATTKIRKKRNKNGALQLESTEIKFNLDENNNPVEIIVREQGKGEKLIEDLMIIANVTVATTFTKLNLPTLYRIHEDPPSKKIETLKLFLLKAHLIDNFPSIITPSSLGYWLNSIEDKSLRTIASNQLLRSLAKARYSSENAGHFGLSEEDYLHFTSPIRRYPDLLVHRLLRQYILEGHDCPNEVAEDLLPIGDHLSLTERRAQKIERDVDSLLAAKYMSKHIGEEFKGIVTSLTHYGMYLELENGIDVLLPYTNIDEDIYIYEEELFEVSGKENNTTYTIGNELDVVVTSVDMDRKEIIMSTSYFYNNKEEIIAMQTENRQYQKEHPYSPSGSRKSYGDRDTERKSYGRKSYGEDSERKSYGDRKSSGDSSRGSYGRKPYGERKSYGERDSEHKSYGRKSYGEGSERKSYGDRKPSGERSSYGRKSYGDRDSEHKSYGRKSYGEGSERKSYGDRKSTYGDRNSEHKSYGRKPYGESSERKSYGDRKSSYGDRKPSGDSSRGTYGRKSYGDKDSSRRTFGNKSSDSYNKKSYGDRGSERKSYGDRKSSGSRDYNKSSSSDGKRSYSSSSRGKSSYSSNSSSRGSKRPVRSYEKRDNRR